MTARYYTLSAVLLLLAAIISAPGFGAEGMDEEAMAQAAQAFGQSMAGATMAALPPIIFFLLLQRYFIEGISMTGMKG